MSADQDGDGRLDQWTYLDGNRPLRGEGDSDGDGRIDRWEYFDGNAQLIKVGTSSQNDGVEDTWTYQDTSARIELSRKRDRQIDRREFYAGNALVRAEDDTNADGHIDQWARYEGGVLTEASFDVALATGRPDTRLRYDARGQFLAIETDRDGDGIFERVTDPAAAAAAKAGVQR